MNTPMIQTKELKKYFSTKKGELHAVDGVNISIEKGETLGVVGESGCGKSTLGRVILKLLEPTSGEIYFEGKDISNFSRSQMKQMRKEMQIIFQDPFGSLNPRMTVSEIIAEPMKVTKMYTKDSDIMEKVFDLMGTVGLAERFVNTYPHELDGGRRQRIGVARALSVNPKFIVCDEPVSALDVSIQAQILNLMQDLQEEFGLTYMFITHDMSVVRHISDNIMVMYLGMMVEFADSEEMFHRRLHPYTKALLAAVPVPIVGAKKERNVLKGEISSPINPKDECRFAKRCPYAKEICFKKLPEPIEATPEHFVACHRVKEINDLD
ncbi:MAG TPA: peptide ABC transporter ATP-binding protein [Clostridiales bacterium]|nr:peptide ABC transporter ATP-binding protein [Clostridiales bacterium]